MHSVSNPGFPEPDFLLSETWVFPTNQPQYFEKPRIAIAICIQMLTILITL